MTLGPGVAGEGIALHSPNAGALHLYCDGPKDGVPVLLFHSINAAGCAAEVRPLYDASRKLRPTYAVDLPGFGLSERSDRRYTPRLYTDAMLEALAVVRRRHGGAKVHVLALSLSCEFLARAAAEARDAFKSVALVSPTGFDTRFRRDRAPGTTREVPGVLGFLKTPAVGSTAFRLLTQPRVIRYFLERTFDSKDIDEALWAYDVESTRAPGAHYAPLAFLSGGLFSADTDPLYEALPTPVWLAHGTRGDFTDYRRADPFVQKPGWSRAVFATGAMPYFQDSGFVPQWEAFLKQAEG